MLLTHTLVYLHTRELDVKRCEAISLIQFMDNLEASKHYPLSNTRFKNQNTIALKGINKTCICVSYSFNGKSDFILDMEWIEPYHIEQ